MTLKNACGIAAAGFYLPEKKVSLRQLAQSAGIPSFVADYAGADTVREASAAEFPSQMAIEAASAALAHGAVDPGDIDLIIYCGAGVPDYILPDTAGRIQAAIGAENAAAFDLVHGCCGMLTGMQVARGQIALDQGVDTVMLVSADKWSQFTRFHSADSVFFGDGGGAVLLRKNHPDLRPLAVEIITKGQYNDLWGVPAGGLRQPPSADTLQKGLHTYVCRDPQRARHEFKEIYIPVMLEAVRAALAGCALKPADIAYFDMVNANLKVLEIVLAQLDLPLERSSADYLKRFGHFGSQDIFFNLDLAVSDRKIKKGDYVVMLTTGIGFSWGSAVLQY